ncbi:MAG: hypothetical protein ISR34_10540 [Pirellulales bacterium]|nr:hypothetical protein [Pirellulales bacterium]
MAKQMLSEVLEGAGNQKTKQDKIDYLRKNGSIPLQTILKGAYDDAVIWNLPEGKPPFKADGAPKGFEMVSLHKQCKKFKHFVKGGVGDNQPAARRERMFIGILESLHSSEAELVLNMKEKTLMGKYNGITSALVAEAFPDLLVKPMANPRARVPKVKKTGTEESANES